MAAGPDPVLDDKQTVRDWAVGTGLGQDSAGTPRSPRTRRGDQGRYIDVYERITGESCRRTDSCTPLRFRHRAAQRHWVWLRSGPDARSWRGRHRRACQRHQSSRSDAASRLLSAAARAPPYPRGWSARAGSRRFGDGVTTWQPGDEVCALARRWRVCPAGRVPAVSPPKPGGVSLVDAAALTRGGLTVWSNIFDLGRLREGETLLVHGGVAVSALSRSSLPSLGRAHPHHGPCGQTRAATRPRCRCRDRLRHADFAAAVHEATAERGLTWCSTSWCVLSGTQYRRAGHHGRLVIIGMQGGTRGRGNLATLMTKRASIISTALQPPSRREGGHRRGRTRTCLAP